MKCKNRIHLAWKPRHEGIQCKYQLGEKNGLKNVSCLWMGFNCHKATELLKGDSLLFTTKNSCYSFDRPQRDGRQSRSLSHPMVLNPGPLALESSSLTTRSLLHKKPLKSQHKINFENVKHVQSYESCTRRKLITSIWCLYC